MKRNKVLGAVTILIAIFIYIPPFSAASAAESCEGARGIQTVWWDGAELKSGQIGRLTVLKDTPLYKLSGDKKIPQKTLKTGGTYRIYAFKPNMLSVGGGMYVNRDAKIKYETPSAEKRELLHVKRNPRKLSAPLLK